MHFKRTADIDPIFSYQESFVQVLCYIYAYELILGLHVFRQTELPRQIDCLTPPPVFYTKMDASR